MDMRNRKNSLWAVACVMVALLAGCCNNCDEAGLPAPTGGGVVTVPVNSPPLTVTTSSCVGPALATNASFVIQFSNPLNVATVTSATVMIMGPAGEFIPGTLSVDATGRLVTFRPNAPLAPNTAFMAVITVGLKDAAGVSLPSSFVCGFTTGGGADVDPPVVASTFPVCNSVNVAVDRLISVTFDGNGTLRDNQRIDPTTINASTFLVTAGGIPVAGTVAYDAATNVATFTPTAVLAANTVFLITITTGVRDVAGNPLPAPFICNFTTGNTIQGIRPVDTPCEAFSVLAGSTVTNTGPTRVNGNVGLTPGSSVTGFPPGILTGGGAIHINDALAVTAQTQLTAAFNDAATRPNSMPLAANLGGLTITPGVYRAASSVAITNGNLTLDGQGDPNAVFIFQIGTTLITGSGSQVILINGAQRANIVYQVGTSATLGTNSLLQGTIIADQSITLTTGATLNGCALTRSGAVTLDSNIVSGM